MTTIDIMDTVREIMLKRAEIKEQFLKTWVAVNVPDNELTPELFARFVLVERITGPGTTEYSVEHKDRFWDAAKLGPGPLYRFKELVGDLERSMRELKDLIEDYNQ